MAKVLVTGADGFIGSHLVEQLVKSGYTVKAFCYYNSFNSWGWLDTLPDTIKNNILLGKSDATDEEIIDALKIANAYEFVKDLPEGIYTNIGDSGNKLSGGQKQRLSIARAVLKNPPIMILDEATSALDTESEKYVQDALENMMQNRTSIVIAHRLSTIQKADNIVVMQKGEIVEQGTHEQLLAKNGTYSKLVMMQSLEQ